MNIIFTEPRGSRERYVGLFLQNHTFKIIMRISCLYMVLLIGSIKLLVASPASGQELENIRVKLEFNNQPLREVFERIEQQTNLLFAWPHEEVNAYPGVSLPKGTYTVKEVLDRVLKGTQLRFRKSKNHVVIFLPEKSMQESEYSKNERTMTPDIGTAFTVTGKVIDGATQQPMAGVNILVKGTVRGTTTDTEGKYVIDGVETEVLVFSFIGFKTFETQINGRTSIDVTMEVDATALKEVVVNAGYYTTTDKTKTGNIARVNAKEIENQPITNPLMSLQGRLTGVDITPYSGAPGSALKVQIRGQNSLRFDGGFPLYVIDGIPVDSRPLLSANSSVLKGVGFDPLSTINPANIASIEILKDADATAIYGSRGANGVILITTKRGHATDRTNLDVSVYRGAGKITRKMDLLDNNQYLEMRHEAFKNANRVPGAVDYDLNGTWDSTRNADWQKELLGETSQVTDAQIALSSGNKNTSFRIGGGFHKESTVFPGDFGYTRQSGSFSLNHQSTNQKLNLALSVNYGAEKHKLFDDSQYMLYPYTLTPVAPQLYNEDGSLNWANSTWTNPLSALKKTDETKTQNLVANANLSYKLFEGLSAKLNAGFTDLHGDELIKLPISAYDPAMVTSSATGETFVGKNARKSWTIEPQLLYTKELQNSVLDVLVGSTFQKSSIESEQIHGLGYSSDVLLGNLKAATSTFIDVSDITEYTYAAIFGRIGYNWKEKYFINLTGRRDGSSRFGPDNRFGNFGAVGVAWIFSNENFIDQNLSFLSFGKLRASYGTAGNDQIGDYKFYDTYSPAQFRYQNSVSLTPTALYNPSFAWEVNRKLEGAIELGFIEDRIVLKTSWYKNRSSNQLVDYPLPSTTGFSTVLSNLEATVENTGWEFELNIEPIQRDNFSWTTSINFSIPRNELIEYPNIEESSYANQYVVGQPLTIKKLYTSTGINPQSGKYEFIDVNEDGLFDDNDKQFIQNMGKQYYGGLMNQIRFKNFELSFLFQYAKQSVESTRSFFNAPGLRANQPTTVMNRWQQDGDQDIDYQLFSTRLSTINATNTLANQSNLNVEDGTFIRLKTLSISYALPQKLVEKVKGVKATIFVTGQNLFTYTEYSGWDPETGMFLPPLKILTIGIQANF